MDNFLVQENVLVANVDLCWENHTEFSDKCKDLMVARDDEIVLDLSNVQFIFSAYMGTIGRLISEAAQSKKKLTIRISDHIFWLFEMAGFEKMVRLEVQH